MKSELIEYADGTNFWFLNRKQYGINKPALGSLNVIKEWRLDGKMHREDGPAIECSDGTKIYYQNGKLHREDGPAIEHPNAEYWYLNDQLHREDGPAIIDLNGTKEWWIKGKRHREDGPAVEFANGDKEWWINGIMVDEYDPNNEDCKDCEYRDCESCCDGRFTDAVNEYASTCDGCGELTSNELMWYDEKTQLGYCDECVKQMDKKGLISQKED
jgi:hypothetical protein